MKSKLWFPLIIIASVLILSIIGCKKSNSDARDKYIGNWAFTTYYSETIDGNYIKADTIFYNGVIEYGEGENELVIYNTESNVITVLIRNDGTLEKRDSRANPIGWGELIGNKEFRFRWSSGE